MKSSGMARLGWVGLVLLGSMLGRTALAADTYVSDTTGDDGNDGLSWTTAKKTIQAGVTAAGSSGTVLVTNGTYTLASEIDITQGVTVRGFDGKSNTFVNGNWATRCFHLNNANATIDDLTITNGNAAAGNGGGVQCDDGKILNCTIDSNQCPNGYGGGVCMIAGLMTNCTIGSNNAYAGGGVYLVSGTISNCFINGNSTLYFGGGMYMVGGLVVGGTIGSNTALYGNAGGVRMAGAAILRNCTITGNKTMMDHGNYAADGGGANISGTAVLEDCIVSNNAVMAGGAGSGGWGGGVYLWEAGTVRDCTVVNNNAYGWPSAVGGGMFANSSATIISNCFIKGNYSAAFGGGIYMAEGTARDCVISTNSSIWAGGCLIANGILQNCLIVSNFYSLNGGCGVYMVGGTLLNCTIADNHGTDGCNGGGVYTAGGGALTNCIVYHNTVSGGGTGPNYYGSGGTWAYSCSTPKPDGTGNIDSDPLFADLAAGDFHLKSRKGRWTANGWVQDDAHSPCINAGDPASAYSLEPSPNGGRVNMGVYGNTAQASKSAPVGPNTIIYVSTSQGNDSNDGFTWASPKKTIQGGVNAAFAGETVLVTNGTYELTDQISIGKGITVRSVNGKTYTFVNGNYPTATNRCFYVGAVGAVVDGFTISNGYLVGNDYGAGVYIATNGVVRDCRIRGNTCWSGAGVYCDRGGVVQNSEISDNSADPASGNSSGGGAYLFYGGILTNCTISNNVASGNQGLGGGGVYACVGGEIVDCRIVNNQAWDGGGILFYGGGGRAIGCTIRGNSAVGANPQGCGGGIDFFLAGYATNCTVSENYAAWYGGGIYMIQGGQGEGCAISNNSTPKWGSGAYFSGNGGILKNCLIVKNSGGGNGGCGAYFSGGGSLQNCSVVTNAGAGAGGGVYCDGGGALANCIVYYNNGIGSPNYTNVSGGTWSYSCTTPAVPGTGNIVSDPLFASVDGEDYHLKSARGRWTSGGWVIDAVHSACIDAGNPDDLGYVNEPAPNGGRINVGAYGGTYQASKGYLDVPAMLVEPAQLSSEVWAGATPASQTVNVRNVGPATIAYSVTVSNPAWLSCSSYSGILDPYETNVLNVDYGTTADWSTGISNNTISVASTNGDGITRQVAVAVGVWNMQEMPTLWTTAMQIFPGWGLYPNGETYGTPPLSLCAAWGSGTLTWLANFPTSATYQVWVRRYVGYGDVQVEANEQGPITNNPHFGGGSGYYRYRWVHTGSAAISSGTNHVDVTVFGCMFDAVLFTASTNFDPEVNQLPAPIAPAVVSGPRRYRDDSALATPAGWRGFTVGSANKFTEYLNDAVPAVTSLVETLELWGAPNQYISGTFNVRALTNAEPFRVSLTNLTGPGAFVVGTNEIDLRVVGLHERIRVLFENTAHDGLAPDMLLRDDRSGVVPTNTYQGGYGGGVCTSSIPAHESRQFWLTVHMPPNAPAGVYEGTMLFQIPGMPNRDLALPVAVDVLPMDLQPVNGYYSIYHAFQPVFPEWPGYVTSERYLLELKDIARHGLNSVTLYGGTGTLVYAQEAGLTEPPCLMYYPSGNEANELALAAELGFDDLYYYGIDEPSSPSQIAACRAEAIRRLGLGLHMMTAICNPTAYAGLWDVVDRPVLHQHVFSGAGAMDNVLSMGFEPASYWFTVISYPLYYRAYAGLYNRACGYIGTCPWSYADYTDGRVPTVANGVSSISYPDVTGNPIPTTRWEEYREGIDDVRYLQALERAIMDAEYRLSQANPPVGLAEAYANGYTIYSNRFASIDGLFWQYMMGLQGVSLEEGRKEMASAVTNILEHLDE